MTAPLQLTILPDGRTLLAPTPGARRIPDYAVEQVAAAFRAGADRGVITIADPVAVVDLRRSIEVEQAEPELWAGPDHAERRAELLAAIAEVRQGLPEPTPIPEAVLDWHRHLLDKGRLTPLRRAIGDVLTGRWYIAATDPADPSKHGDPEGLIAAAVMLELMVQAELDAPDPKAAQP